MNVYHDVRMALLSIEVHEMILVFEMTKDNIIMCSYLVPVFGNLDMHGW